MIKSFFSRLLNDILPPFLIVVAFTAFTLVAHGALTKTPTNVAPADQAHLNAQLASTGTSTTLTAVKKWVNGVRVTGCFNSPSAFILIEDDLGRREWASYDAKSCDSSNITTLSGMRRGLSPTNPSFAAGTGLDFDAGATVSVNDYPLYNNNALYKDVATQVSGSGFIKCVGTRQACIAVGDFTTAQRDAFTHNSGSTIIHNTTLGNLQWYDGSTWLSLATATGSFVNASETVAGKVELGSVKDQSGATTLGETGAPTVVQTKNLTSTGGIPSYEGRIPTLNGTGQLSLMMGGNGTGGTLGIASGSFLLYQGLATPRALRPTAANQVITSTDGTNWKAGSAPETTKTVLTAYGDSATLGASSTATFILTPSAYSGTGGIIAGTIVAGVCYEYHAVVVATWAAGTIVVRPRLGATELGVFSHANEGGDVVLHGTFCGTAAAGASVAVKVEEMVMQGALAYNSDYNVPNIATNTDLQFQITGSFTSSNGGNNMILKVLTLKKLSI